jgi:hypothetical protein
MDMRSENLRLKQIIEEQQRQIDAMVVGASIARSSLPAQLLYLSQLLGLAAARADTLPLRSLRGGATEPVQLISGSGELLSARASEVAASVPALTSVVASVGGQHRGRRLLNAVFGTSFDTELQLGAPSADVAGAWLAAAPSMPGTLVLDTCPLAQSGQQRGAADGGKLACFSLAVADVLIMHSPCVAPTAALVKESYERVFSHHIGVMASGAESRTTIVHVSDVESGLSEAAVRTACKDAWSAAAEVTEFKGKAFSDLFDMEVVSVPSSEGDQGFNEAVTALRAKVSGIGGKLGKAAFAESASSAWSAVGAVLDSEPSELWMRERFLAARAYETAYSEGQVALRKWYTAIAKGRIVHGFGPAASAMFENAMSSFDAGVSTCSAASAGMVAQRRARLAKALQNDIAESFLKQQRQLSTSTINKYKAQLVKVMGRGGTVHEWQQEALRRNAEKHYDAVIGGLLVDGVIEQTRAQLTSAFGKQLTELTAKYLDSPPMQLQAIGAMRRRTGKGQKPPRGIQAGLGLVGAVRSSFGGGQGNIQTYAGYVDGLNSLHVMFANDGLIADSSGSEPPPLRWQPKMNFDISI